MRDDARLLELARLGNEAAFAELVQRHRSLLLAHCRSVVGDSAAQDAAQQALISAWHALRRGCEVQNARAWLFTIAHRCALQLLRGRPEPTEELPLALAGAGSPHEVLERRTQVRATLAAVADLPPHERDALLLTTVYGRSGRDAARALGVSEPEVRQLVFRARGRARQALIGAGGLSAVFGVVARRVLGMPRAAGKAARGARLALQRAAGRLGLPHLGGHWTAAALGTAVVVASPPIMASIGRTPSSRPAARAIITPAPGAERQQWAVIAKATGGSRVRAGVAAFAPRREALRASSPPARTSAEPVVLAAAPGLAAQPAQSLTSTAKPRSSATYAGGGTPAADRTAPLGRLAPIPAGAVLYSVAAPVLQAASSVPPAASGALLATDALAQPISGPASVATAPVGEAAARLVPAPRALHLAP